MLIITRAVGKAVYIGDDIKVTVTQLRGGQVKLGIEAPRSLRVLREEIHDAQKLQTKRVSLARGVKLGENNL